MVSIEVEFQNKKEHVLRGNLRYVEKENKIPVVIVLHDYEYHCEHEFIINISNHLMDRGFVVFRFDFHGHGQSEGEMKEFNITQQVDDLISAVDYLEKLDFTDGSRIGIYGHGMGADVALIGAGDDARIKNLILHAARADLFEHITSRFSNDELSELNKKGFVTHVKHGRIEKEFFEHLKKYDLMAEISQLKIPILFVHGKNDFRVSEENSRRLYSVANEPKRLEIFENADHEFRDETIRSEMFEIVGDWFSHWLSEDRRYSYKY
ncbi:prolyl oligopeptidase family serine peptidase [Candidatus Woesearchaeota archaeon]|jgi:uncharacterized protein|nr:prolyl oligopeptidase family serine peptidase [Candidatus Woesearchaeota archaeon]MBT6520450.1 prolyl oligopeptidase family serine peptidase [Candidatus Woesearchaeota archaeon]MBT7367344.1 prolyl oligopeptidase family serine peptidase [Candidatus Woesearchaeota archaeon]